MQNGKTIKTRKNVDFNVDIFNCGNSSNIIFTPEDKSGIIICKAVQRREGQQNERTIAV